MSAKKIEQGVILEVGVSEAIIQQLKIDAETQYTKLRAQGPKIVTLISHLDLLLKRYQTNLSYFSRIVNWFGQMSWWGQTLLPLGLTTASILVGILFNNITLFAISGLALYVAVIFLIKNHFEITAHQDKILAADYLEIEANLNESVSEFNLLNQKSHEVLCNLSNQNICLAAGSRDFTQQIQCLKMQNAHFNQSILELETTKNTIQVTKDALCTELEHMREALKETQKSLATKSQELEKITAQFEETHLKLTAHGKEIGVLNEQLQQNLFNLSFLKNSLQTQIGLLTQYSNEYQIKTQEMSIKLSTLTDTVVDLQAHTDDVLAKADVYLEETRELLETVSEKQQQLNVEEQELYQEIEKERTDLEALLKRNAVQRVAKLARKKLDSATLTEPESVPIIASPY